MLTTKKNYKIIYTYNEHLPCHRAHDVYVFQNCNSLAEAGFNTTLVCGHKSQHDLSRFYLGHDKSPLEIKRKFLLRKSRFLGISWNIPFFRTCLDIVKKERPTFVISSVLKQGISLTKNKTPDVQHIYEVHELAYYPGRALNRKFYIEKEMLNKMDLVVVSTHELKRILQKPPYALTTPIEVVELAVCRKPLPLPSACAPLKLLYVGQLYKGQGIEALIDAMEGLKGIELHIIGGKPHEVTQLKALTRKKGAHVRLYGFIPPAEIEEKAKECHAFAAPFELSGKMPYVAHTKLYEYAMWGRPFIAPDTPLVTQNFKKGLVTYAPGQLKTAISALHTNYPHLLSEIQSHPYDYTWERRAKKYKTLLSSCLCHLKHDK
jgi:glycosyltransferase involved in cell wall biosynthesis